MNKVYLLSLTILLLCSKNCFGQLTGTKNIPGDYATLALAITDLNAQGVGSGGVILNLLAGNPQAVTAGGYIVGGSGNILVGATNPTAVNAVIIEGNNNTITTSNTLTSGSINDAIFKLIGADYITIQDFVMVENAANTIISTGSNNVTEWGIALFHVSVTDGAQNNTIINNTISLNRAYSNSFGIYSNARHTASAIATVDNIINNTTAPNNNNKIYGNNISNVNMGIAFIGSSAAANQDVGNDVGGANSTTGNTITNWGGASAANGYVSNSNTSYCILVNMQKGENVSYNNISSAIVSGSSVTIRGILKAYTAGAPTGTFTSSITHNTISLRTAFTSGTFECIRSQDITTAASATVNINDNLLLQCALSGVSTSSDMFGIVNSSALDALNINNNIFRSNTSTATTGGFTAILNTGAVANTININNNQLGDATGGAITFAAATTGTITGISNTANIATANINANTMQGVSCVSSGTFTAITNTGLITTALNINSNQLGTAINGLINYSAATGNDIVGILNAGADFNCTLTIQSNDIRGIVHAVTGTSSHTYIKLNPTDAGEEKVLNNSFTDLSVNTSGNVTFISRMFHAGTGTFWTCNNNHIVNAFSKTAPGGEVRFYQSSGYDYNIVILTETGNNFSNVTVTGNTVITGWYNINQAKSGPGYPVPYKTITGNTFSNITGGNGSITIMYISNGYATCSSNTISNISGTGDIAGISTTSTNNSTTASNTISGLSSSGTGGNIRGIYTFSSSSAISSNNINTLSSTGANASIVGIDCMYLSSISDNTINNLAGSGTGAPVANGISISGNSSGSIYQNKIYTILESGAVTGTSALVNGIVFQDGGTITTYNNFIADLKVTNASIPDATRGISIVATRANSTFNIYYNSIYLNGVSSGADFGTSGIYHLTNATATTANLNMIDNIIVNTSAANGAGVTAAYRRSDITLANFATTSDNNLFYAGTPSPTGLIYYDGTNADLTLAAYKTSVSVRDANSISLMPNFVSATDLHISPVTCSFDGKGKPIAGITTDIDATTRNSTIPDIGADEVAGFTAAANAALATTSTNLLDLNRYCSDDAGWTYYTDPADESKFLFGINWDPLNIGSNVAAKAAATPRLQVDAADFSVTNISIPAGTWTMKRYWNVDLHGASLNNPVNVRFFYTAAEKVTADAEAASFQNTYGGSIEPATWFKTRTTSFAGDAAHMNYDAVYNAISLVDINAGAAAKLNNVLYAEFDGVTSFSGGTYATGVGPNTPLPVTFNYLRGIKQSGTHLLSWKVTCNSTLKVTLVLERSADAGTFNDVYSITADAVRCQQEFTHTDANPLNGINYYRLRIIDADGKITYSNIISLLNAVKGFEVINIAPNPVTTGSFKLNVTSAAAGRMDVVITDMQGRVVGKQTVTLIAGYNSLDMNVGNLAAGTYNIYGNTDQDKSTVIRFVKQ